MKQPKTDCDTPTNTNTPRRGRRILRPRQANDHQTVPARFPGQAGGVRPPEKAEPQHPTAGQGSGAPHPSSPSSPSAVRIPYHSIRHALGKYGATKVSALDVGREGDTVVLRPVSSRHLPLQHYIELPFAAEVLQQVVIVLTEFATQAEAEEAVFRSKLRSLQGEHED
jgi:hypothetical protein